MTRETQQYTKREAIRQFGGDFLNALLDAIEAPSLATLRKAYMQADHWNQRRFHEHFEGIRYMLRQSYSEWHSSIATCQYRILNDSAVSQTTKQVTKVLLKSENISGDHEFVLVLVAFVCGVKDKAARARIEEHFPEAGRVMQTWSRWPEIADGIRAAFPGMRNLDDYTDNPVQFTSGGYRTE